MDIDPSVLSGERCASAFGRMFWAFLFFIDIRIGFDNSHIDVLPDFVGWILFAAALGTIPDLSPRVRGLRSMALWLVVLSLFEVVEIRIPLSSDAVNTWISYSSGSCAGLSWTWPA